MADIVNEIVCDNAQEKLLIMLLERVEKLEDELKESNQHMARLLSHTTSNFFCVNLSGPLDRVTKQYANLTTVMDDIVKTIQEAIPCIHIYALYYHDNTGCQLTIQTEKTWLLESIVVLLDTRLRRYVNLNSWTLKYEWNLDLERYKLLM